MKWALMPQLQPARTLLFITAMAIMLASVCGCLAVRKERWLEAFGWFFVTMLPPLVWDHLWLAALLAAGLVAAARYRWLIGPALAGYFFLIPIAGHVSNYPALHTPELKALSDWARRETPIDSVFAFPYAGKSLDPGIFRSESLRAVYVDWKGGGQVNYLPQLGEEWWARWQDVMLKAVDFEHYRELGIAYIVVPPARRIASLQPVFADDRYIAYLVAAKSPQAKDFGEADVKIDNSDPAHAAAQVGALPVLRPVRNRGREECCEEVIVPLFRPRKYEQEESYLQAEDDEQNR
jgi:hypothetical protein